VTQGWDSLRTERNQSLDAILESLGQQHVPPNLHLMSSGSSLFGSQHSLPDITEIPDEETSRSQAGTSSPADAKSKWKTLRDFVDEKAIEDALEQMEEDRNSLDVTMLPPPRIYTLLKLFV
jgi:autophagy-related protein 17